MSYRVEELAARATTSVDTVRYYQARSLLPPPTRIGRVAWYGDEHLERLAQIRRLQGRGFGLAVIQRLLAGELDHADEELIAAVANEADAPEAHEGASTESPGADEARYDDARADAAGYDWLTIAQLAERSGIPRVVLDAVVREGLLVPHRVHGEDRYSQADVTAAAAGLRLLQHGLPLSELLELARVHTLAMRATAEKAVDLFDRYVRQALRSEGVTEDVAAERLVSAFEEILPATLTIVSHHFRRTLLSVAQEHIERVGTDGERRLVVAAAERDR
jgi:DNA-binding transcriptional MerR regulator